MYHVFSITSSIMQTNAAATGSIPSDIILVNCSLVNVYTREIQENIQIAIKNDRIAYVGPNAIHTKGKKTTVIDLKNRFVTPSFADPHIHIDHFTLPSEFVKKSLLCGVTSLFPDSIDVVSVTGFRGFKEFVKQTQNLPMRFFHTAINSNFRILIPLFIIFFYMWYKFQLT